MVVDLDACIGCSACALACQAENNVPIVGPAQVRIGRRMHWLRIDRYLDPPTGPDASAQATFQPMLCQHCERAPCEYVCPVAATTHAPDGINEQTYNRCVGTRFCSNNCPYRIRRFNWFDYSGAIPELQRLQLNPAVTVRERGVMEKCTFCVHRIRGRDPADGPVTTACQDACPTRAITFGDLTEEAVPGSVAALRDDPRAYRELTHLGTEPRVSYLAARARDGSRGGAR
jgi:molybdopterin-containing oxidoreductase family iron-sulfur binding subunit